MITNTKYVNYRVLALLLCILALTLFSCTGKTPLKTSVKETSASKNNSKPNILWIIAEDFSPDAGCYGNKLARTPNIDRLASEGRKFTKAFTSAPSCCPSRSGFMTGMWQNAICAPHQRPAVKKKLPDGVHVITKYFHDA